MKIKYGDYFEIDTKTNQLEFVGERATTLKEAWRISLDKWQILSTVSLAGKGTLINSSVSTCGLCQLYGPHFMCDGCPIALDGHILCAHTPYLDCRSDKPLKESQAAAKAELKYLKKLYKKEKNKRKMNDGCVA